MAQDQGAPARGGAPPRHGDCRP